MTYKTNKSILILGIAATIILGGIIATTNTFSTALAQTASPSTTSQCPPGDQVQHWDKIVFTIQAPNEDGKGPRAIGTIPAQMLNTDLDIKIADQPGVVANLKLEIVDAMANQYSLTTVQKNVLFNSIKIISDSYETVNCGMTGPQGPPGPQGPQGPAGSSGTGTSGEEQSPPITKFLKVTAAKQGVITGSVTEKGKEGTIAVIAVDHSIISPRDPATGLPTGKRMHSPLVITTHIDKATPLLYESLVTNENLPTVELDYYQTGQDGKQTLYFKIVLTNANISSIKQTNLNSQDDPNANLFGEYEELAFTYQKIEWTWVDGGITAQDDWEAPAV